MVIRTVRRSPRVENICHPIKNKIKRTVAKRNEEKDNMIRTYVLKMAGAK